MAVVLIPPWTLRSLDEQLTLALLLEAVYYHHHPQGHQKYINLELGDWRDAHSEIQFIPPIILQFKFHTRPGSLLFSTLPRNLLVVVQLVPLAVPDLHGSTNLNLKYAQTHLNVAQSESKKYLK